MKGGEEDYCKIVMYEYTNVIVLQLFFSTDSNILDQFKNVVGRI